MTGHAAFIRYFVHESFAVDIHIRLVQLRHSNVQIALISILKKVNFEIYIADRKATTCI